MIKKNWIKPLLASVLFMSMMSCNNNEPIVASENDDKEDSVAYRKSNNVQNDTGQENLTPPQKEMQGDTSRVR